MLFRRCLIIVVITPLGAFSVEFTHSSGAMLNCDRSDYVGIYLRIYLHSFLSPQTKDELNRSALELGGTR